MLYSQIARNNNCQKGSNHGLHDHTDWKLVADSLQNCSFSTNEIVPGLPRQLLIRIVFLYRNSGIEGESSSNSLTGPNAQFYRSALTSSLDGKDGCGRQEGREIVALSGSSLPGKNTADPGDRLEYSVSRIF